MTKQELNRDCKRLVKRYKAKLIYDGHILSDDFVKEFKRVYSHYYPHCISTDKNNSQKLEI